MDMLSCRAKKATASYIGDEPSEMVLRENHFRPDFPYAPRIVGLLRDLL